MRNEIATTDGRHNQPCHNFGRPGILAKTDVDIVPGDESFDLSCDHVEPVHAGGKRRDTGDAAPITPICVHQLTLP